ncbi:MAG: hypothetical protein V1663_00740 [archaeon]
MGFFDIFKKKEIKEEQKQINLDELDQWFVSLSEEIFKDVNLKLDEIRKQIDYEKNNLRDNIKILKEAKLLNTKIPERAIHLMEGNREIYIQRLNLLLGQINLPKNNISLFYNSFENYLNDFSRITIRNYHILMEFFRDYIINISSGIKKLDSLIKQAKKLVDDSGLEKTSQIKNKITEVKNKIKHKNELSDKKESSKAIIKDKEKNVFDSENDLKKLEDSSEYKNYINLINKEILLNNQIKNIEQEFLSNIKFALKRYERLSLEDKLIRKYVEYSIRALLEDTELKIVGIIKNMKESIIKGTLDLKDSKKDKILEELDKLNKDYFDSFLKRYKDLKKDLDKLNLDIKESELKEIKEIKDKIEEHKKLLEEERNNLENLNKDYEKINVEELKRLLETDIREILKKDIKIV